MRVSLRVSYGEEMYFLSVLGKISYGGKSGNSKSSLASRLPSLQGQMKAPILVESSKAK